MRNHLLVHLALAVTAAAAAHAAGPRTVAFQGRLTTPAGQPVPDGARNLAFRLYTTPVGGAPLWNETQAVTTQAGMYSVALGAVNPFPEALQFDGDRYLGVSVAGEAEMTPRLPLRAVPYALGLSLPVSNSHSGAGVALRIGNAGTGTAILAERTAAAGPDPALVGRSSSEAPVAVGVLGEIAATSPGGFSAAVRGNNNGTGGLGIGVWGSQAGSGWGVYGAAPSGIGTFGQSTAGYGVYASSATGTGLYAASNTGTAASVETTGSTNSNPAFTVVHPGIGHGMTVDLTNAAAGGRGISVSVAGTGTGVFSTTVGGNALWGIASSMSSAGVIGDNTDGEAVVGRSRGGVGVGAVVGRNDDEGPGVRGFNASGGAGGRFETLNGGGVVNTGNALEADAAGSGNGLYVNHRGGGISTTAARNLAVFASNGVNKARINNAGKGYFNGGTQASGADVAEAFAVEGDHAAYEPGDVLVISTSTDRTVAKSTTPHSTALAGVYSTRPGSLLSERDVEADHSDLVPLGVIGVIPTKVTAENGAIRRGDLLVTSSTPGHAMKAGPNPPAGSVLGKALAEFESEGAGLIRVLVNVR